MVHRHLQAPSAAGRIPARHRADGQNGYPGDVGDRRAVCLYGGLLQDRESASGSAHPLVQRIVVLREEWVRRHRGRRRLSHPAVTTPRVGRLARQHRDVPRLHARVAGDELPRAVWMGHRAQLRRGCRADDDAPGMENPVAQPGRGARQGRGAVRCGTARLPSLGPRAVPLSWRLAQPTIHVFAVDPKV